MKKKAKGNLPYLERDISWMYFNSRILQEAGKQDVPLLERLTFLGIYSNNLDEFFRVRVATLNRIIECTDKTAAVERTRAKQQLRQINKLNNRYSERYGEVEQDVYRALRQENICLITEAEATEAQLAYIRSFYRSQLNGNILPVWFSAIHRITAETDENIYLAVRLTRTDGENYEYAFLELPVNLCGRFVQLPEQDGIRYFMYLDDVVRCCLPLLFPGLQYARFEAYSFKFTRDAEMEIDNDSGNGVLQKISKGIKSRSKGEPLRVIYDAQMPKDLLRRVLNKLDLDRLDTVLAGSRYQNHKDFMRFPDCGRPDLHFPAWPPILRRELSGEESIFTQIRERDRFLHVPYHSFDSFLRLLQEAAVHKDVRSIKITLYRLARNSKVIRALVAAAQNGKKVTVVIELFARFDEASNMAWSKKMQDAGIRVIYGVEGLKVHSKVVHIEFRQGPDIACISTGNFHEGNARTYTDCLLMTASRPLTREIDNVFTFIERPYASVHFKELLVSPNDMRRRFLMLINQEIRNRKAGKPAYIRVKVNHVTDPVIIAKLYEASQAGVPITLLVRGNCSLVTGIPGVSDNIRACGIIDRYLEHARIFIFAAGGEEKIYIGSADWMPRNLDNRIEVIAPVHDPVIREEMKRIVDAGLQDNRQGRIVDGSGENLPWPGSGDTPFRSQEALYEHYKALEENGEETRNDR